MFQPAAREFNKRGFPDRSAFTLIEALMAIAISTIILGGITAAILSTTRELDEARDDGTVSIRSRQALAQIVDDLRTATYMDQYKVGSDEGGALVMTVPDRTGDGEPETIRYDFSGTAGDPLMRTFNDNPSALLVSSVQSLMFVADLRAQPTMNDIAGGVVVAGKTNGITANRRTFVVGSGGIIAQSIVPSLVARATSYQPVDIRIRAYRAGAAEGTIRASLFAVDTAGNYRQIAESFMSESSLSATYSGMVTFSFAGSPVLPVTDTLLVVFSSVNSTSVSAQVSGVLSAGLTLTNLSPIDAMTVEFDRETQPKSNMRMLISTDEEHFGRTQIGDNLAFEFRANVTTQY